MAHISEWVASLVGGRTVRRSIDRVSLGTVAPGQLENAVIETDHPKMPLLQIDLEPALGAHADTYTRTMMGISGRSLSVPMVRLTPDPACPDRSVWVCLLPDAVVITNRDPYW